MDGMERRIRDARPDEDAASCAAIYAPYVQHTAISFELDAPEAAEMSARIKHAQATHAWLVLEDGDCVTGYAYGDAFRGRAAYRYTAEVSVYMDMEHRRSGGGRALYAVLLDQLASRGYATAVAGMTLPNDASVGLHAAMGFTRVGTFRRVGWKHGVWHDVLWMERSLRSAASP